ncbi:hypothetical protein K491DRAFT_687346 [Lophiostoma macrostomum CBS 122681]|uniref:Uncharacterized protein n=1 Tax=Lophiostoma macrostomum CBS 122681 TaxID=1314788 RepID=A0A6A6TQY4_9PLEO|nr:hypothetical protein K491DRAFT_687346 [Lophiostoma macrostomum CBS 122681]
MPPTLLSSVQPSPKRKRDHPPTVPLHVNTTLRSTSTPPRGSPTPTGGADSPRNVVADQLRGMTITALHAIPMSPLTPTDDIVRKKPKLEFLREDSATSDDLTDADSISNPRTHQAIRKNATHDTLETDGQVEIPETPQASFQSQTSQSRTFSPVLSITQPTPFASSASASSAQQFTSSTQTSKARSHPSQPRPRNKSPSPPPTSLTWQDNEITGHLVDPTTDPEDDGTGLNGIGFKPTPALAYARAQKRRQQLMDWRARETREARAKRSERRRRGIGGAAGRSREGTVERDTAAKDADAAARRAVRFAV